MDHSSTVFGPLVPIISRAQLIGNKAIRKILEKQIEKHLPEIIDGAIDLENLSIDDIRVNKKSICVKGSLKVKKKGEDGEKVALPDPARFKAKLSISLADLGLKYLKIHPPGSHFLGFPIYRKVLP